MFVVASGRVEVAVETAPGVEKVVREMGRGENLGELALLTDEPRSATIRAVRDSQLLRLSRAGFQALLRDHPDTSLALTRILARWIRDANRRRPPRVGITTVAVVAGTSGIAPREFARSLTGALARYGDTLLLDAEGVDARLGSGAARAGEESPEHSQVTEWLNQQELEHRFLVYQADGETTAWSRRCVRQADAILAVVTPDSAPRLGPVARYAADGAATRRGIQRHLVLLHPAETQAPSGTDGWLALGSFSGHHHVREDRPEDTARVARHLAGRAVGVVMGGGGALGFAHIGVVRALREAGVQVDRFGGASMGSLVAGMFAQGDSAEQVQKRLEWAFRRVAYRPHQNRTFPVYSLDTGEQVRRMLGWAFEDGRIEDLWHSFFCTTTNLTTGRYMVHREGPAVRWIEASVSIPGVVPPAVTDDGELLADGGLLNNLPANVMLAGGQGPVVAVSVSSDQEPRVRAGRRRAPSGWEALLGRILPLKEMPDFPNIIRILHRSAVIGSIRSQRNIEDDVDLYLEPKLTAFDMFSWKSLGAIVEAGYRSTVERLEREHERLDALVDGKEPLP